MGYSPIMISAEALCPICGNRSDEAPQRVAKYLRIRKHQHLFHCDSCDHYWKSPAPELDPGMTDRWELDQGLVTYGEFTATAREASLLPSHIRGRIDGASAPVLDFGAGDGSFVSACLNTGLAAYGIEPNSSAFAANETASLAMYASVSSLPVDSFQLINSNHVFEHLVDPLSHLRKLGGLCARGGRLIVEVPNEVGSGKARLKMLMGRQTNSATSVYEHVQFYSRESLRRAAEFAELVDVRVTSPSRGSASSRVLGAPRGFGEVLILEAGS
jgi:SAM-dependent methyltransferase